MPTFNGEYYPNMERELISHGTARWHRRNFSRLMAIAVAVLSLIVIASSAINGQGVSVSDLQAKAKASKLKDIVLTYDKFKDKSLITTKPQNLIGFGESFAVGMADGLANHPYGSGRSSGHPSSLLMAIGYEGKGDGLMQTPETLAVIFKSNAKGWVFLKGDNNLYILCDDQRMEFRPLGTDSDITFSGLGGVGVSETLGFAISRSDLQKILTAKKVEMKLGDTFPRKWKSDWSKRIQALLTLTDITPK